MEPFEPAQPTRPLAEAAAWLIGPLEGQAREPLSFTEEHITRETVMVAMRDGVRLASDLHLPPVLPAPAILMRTPYGRANAKYSGVIRGWAQRGYVVAVQDCRGTGDSEPDAWDYYVYEASDGYDFVDWCVAQPWCDGFLGGCGGSYCGQTQWGMATHPAMSAIAPEMSGLGVAAGAAAFYIPLNAYARSVGKGAAVGNIPFEQLEAMMLPETLANGIYDKPFDTPTPPGLLRLYPELGAHLRSADQARLWSAYCDLAPDERARFIKAAVGGEQVTMASIEALSEVFGPGVAHDAHSLPIADHGRLAQAIKAPPLMVTGWYDWALNDALATWRLIRERAAPDVASQARLIITPAAHNTPGYHEGPDEALRRAYRTENLGPLIQAWCAQRRGPGAGSWPRVVYYLMGGGGWMAAPDWPPPEAETTSLYLREGGGLSPEAPPRLGQPDTFTYDPVSPTPTLGGSVLSSVYPPGSVDVSALHQRPDVLTYTTPPLTAAVDVVGPLRLILHAASSATDTDFTARLSDVFPDGRAIQLQSGILRARYRHADSVPAPLTPGQVYAFEIDMWATANRFERGHAIRLDIASADFPRFERNSNRAGAGPPVKARQEVFHTARQPSRLELSILGRCEFSPGK